MYFLQYLLGGFGLRCGEAIALRRCDIVLQAEVPYLAAAGHVWGAKKSPGKIYVSHAKARVLKRILKEGISVARQVKSRHGLRGRTETFQVPEVGFIFQGRQGSAKSHLNYMAVYHSVRNMAPLLMRKHAADGAKHDPNMA